MFERFKRRRSSNTSPAIDWTGILIELTDIRKAYQTPAGDFLALKDINLQIERGEFVVVQGKSGAGKSTLINMITGIGQPTAGQIRVGSHAIHNMGEEETARWRGVNAGVIFQSFQLMPMLTCAQNVMLPMDYCKVYSIPERPKRAMELLAMVGLEDQAHKLPTMVSSGQQQSAAIARSLATDPDIILADEPTGNLDSRSAETVLNLFEKLAASGKTVMIVTHDPSITQRTDQTVILSDGEIIDQTIARVLPLLSHPQMLAATHQAKRQDFPALKTIISQGEAVDHFYMIVKGQVDVVVSSDNCGEMSLACLGPGQFFGEVELTHEQNSIASVRASKYGSELAVIPKDEFFNLIDGSPLTRAALTDIADTRVGENKRKRVKDC